MHAEGVETKAKTGAVEIDVGVHGVDGADVGEDGVETLLEVDAAETGQVADARLRSAEKDVLVFDINELPIDVRGASGREVVGIRGERAGMNQRRANHVGSVDSNRVVGGFLKSRIGNLNLAHIVDGNESTDAKSRREVWIKDALTSCLHWRHTRSDGAVEGRRIVDVRIARPQVKEFAEQSKLAAEWGRTAGIEAAIIAGASIAASVAVAHQWGRARSGIRRRRLLPRCLLWIAVIGICIVSDVISLGRRWSTTVGAARNPILCERCLPSESK